MPGDYVVGIVTTQVAVPGSLAEAMTAATTAGTAEQLRRELARSQTNYISGTEAGQRVGDWTLQTQLGSVNQNAVAPGVQGDKVFVYPSVFYPAAAAIGEATTIRLGSGEERSAIDFRLRPVPASRISGQLLGLKGPESHTALSLVPTSANSTARDYDLPGGVDGDGREWRVHVSRGRTGVVRDPQHEDAAQAGISGWFHHGHPDRKHHDHERRPCAPSKPRCSASGPISRPTCTSSPSS